MGPGAGLDRCGKSRPPTGIRSTDRPARSQLLYRLSYPAHKDFHQIYMITFPISVKINASLEDRVRKLLRPATSTQGFLGFPMSMSKC